MATALREDEKVVDKERKPKDIIKKEARKSARIRKLIKIGKTKLKGCWDKEVKEAIENRKRENRKLRYLAKIMKKV